MEEWILSMVDAFGYLGIGLLIVVENVFPPIPSEVILTFGGLNNMSMKGESPECEYCWRLRECASTQQSFLFITKENNAERRLRECGARSNRFYSLQRKTMLRGDCGSAEHVAIVFFFPVSRS